MEIFEDVINEPQALAKLTDAAHAFFGHDIPVGGAGKGCSRIRRQGTRKKRSGPKAILSRSMMEHPVVLQALEILGGELVDIRTLETRPPGCAGRARSAQVTELR